MLAEATRLVIGPDALNILAEITAASSAEGFEAARKYCVVWI